MIDYNPHDWKSHLFDVEGSMVREITGRLTMCLLWTTAVVAYVELSGRHLEFSPTVHTLVGVALGLLLVFRTNASYDRYWEGRKMWGSIINESRNLGRAARVYLMPAAPDVAQRVAVWTAAFARASMHSLREETGLGPAVEHLPTDEAHAALGAPHVPLHAATRITEALVEARDRGAISDYVLMQVDRNVQLMVDYLGACERIVRTPLPFVYVVHVRRALFLYCYTLPFVLVGMYRWWTILVVLLAAYTFLGIEEIGVEIENPFGRDANDLPLERYCETVERDVLGVLEMPPMAPDPFGASPTSDSLPPPAVMPRA